MQVHKTTGNVFDDLGFAPNEANNLKMRALLMNAIEAEMTQRGLTQTQAASLFGVAQPRVSDLICGKIQKFTIDSLIEMLSKLDKQVHLVIDDRMVA